MSASRPRARELLVLAAGLLAAAALAWAGVTVHDGLRTAGEVAVARLAGTVEDTVKAEWQRMLRASEPPVVPAGETFHWSLMVFAPRLRHNNGRPADRRVKRAELEGSPSVFSTLLEEAARLDLVEQKPEEALRVVQEALAKEPPPELRPEGWLLALQLAVKVGNADLARTQWEHLQELGRRRGTWTQDDETWIPYSLLGWMALPEAMRAEVPSEEIVSAVELEELFLPDDQLTIGPLDEPTAHFEPAAMLVVVCERMQRALPSLERRKVFALESLGTLPEVLEDGRWHLEAIAERPFVVRRVGDQVTGSFYARRELQEALADRSSLPAGFQLDFAGGMEDLGPAVRPRTRLPDSDYEFTLRHADPASLGKAESARLRLLRGALFALSLACAAGGFLTARLLARQRKLAELKSSFIAGVSHDLRTPLASILLLAENLESGVAAGADPARYHRALRKEATRLRRLVDDVLDFSRLERGQAPKLEREELDLARFAAELEEDLGARVREQGREFGCERSELPASAALDAHAVRRALENLVDNALKHGRGAVRLGFAVDSGRLRLTVADDGPGIPAAERERVFEPFERLSANGHVGGVGLGLAIVRSIARAHGGEARVRAREQTGAGAGAVFELDLPLSGDPEEAE
jgi:signal transduction histidine kinase